MPTEPELPIDLTLLTLPDDDLIPLLTPRIELARMIAGDLDIVRAGLVRRIAAHIDVHGLITKNAALGMPVGDIADLLGVTESYVYRVLRDHNSEQ
ncbi:helix-turn-helix domain-containing protein [Streptomyces sp. NPDC102264]|uniref:helix-turn-helix domain-containing protein n=1 Tax=Streptomyces sp. NPDC102264 TaxID=3366149 RepID=UPI00381C24AB